MDKIKDFKTFIKENIDNDTLDNQPVDNVEDDILMNMKDLEWSEELLDPNLRNESMEEDGELDNIDGEIHEEGEESDDKKMMHKKSDNDIDDISESSEEQEYILKDIFSEEE